MSLEQYERFVWQAGMLDEDDPAAWWSQFAEHVGRVASFLTTTSTLRIVAEDTDLTLGVGGRTWIPAGGGENAYCCGCNLGPDAVAGQHDYARIHTPNPYPAASIV